MTSNKTSLAILVLLVVAAIYYERTKTSELQASLTALAKDRDALNRQVSNLTRLMAEARERETVPLPAAETRRIEAPPPPPAALPAVESIPTPGITTTAPAGWAKNGSKPGAYVVGVDRLESFRGMPSAYVKSVVPGVDGFGGMMQTTSAEDLLGKRVRLSGWIKTEEANDGGGHLWLRVDGKQSGTPLQFDNMDNRAVKGTTDWQPYSIVLDVPPESSALAYGFFVQGTGKMWVSGAKMEAVESDIPSTNTIVNRTRSLPRTPVNLTFDPDQPK